MPGTIDLRTGITHSYRREDMITKIAACDAYGECPMWHAFLQRVTDEDLELQHYLQRVAGYCLTGSTREHVLFFFYGTGANGKGVFLNTLRDIWHDYGAVAPMETFIKTYMIGIPPNSPICAASASSSPRKPNAGAAGTKARSRR